MRREETAGEGGNRDLSWLLGEGRLGVSLVQWPLVCGGLRPPGAPTLENLIKLVFSALALLLLWAR